MDFQSYLEQCENEKTVEGVLDYSFRKDLEPSEWAEINRREFDAQAWRINQLIPKQGFVILASISGEKKTWVAMEMARCISHGVNFLGEERFKTEGATVLYLNAENPWSEIQRRGRQLSFQESSPHKLLLLNSDDVNLNSLKGITWFKAFIEFYKIQVVFVDTFRAVAGGLKEERADEIRQFFNHYASLKNKGVVVVWLDHSRKPSNFDGKVPKKEQLLGSTDKTASVEVLLMMQSETGSEEIKLYQRKNRLAKEVDPFKVLMRDTEENGQLRTTLTHGGELEEQENKKDEAKELILTILESGEQTTKVILEQTKKQVGSKNTRAALADLVREGLIDVAKLARENLYFLVKESKAPSERVPLREESNIFDSS